MKKSFFRKISLALAFMMLASTVVPDTALASPQSASAVQIEANASNTEDGYAYYDLKSDGTKGKALDSALNSYIDDEKGAVEVSKTIEATDTENEFKINLKVTSTENFQELELSEDAAVVLVLDRSGSMQWDLDGKGYCNYVDGDGNPCPNNDGTTLVDSSDCAWHHIWGQPSRFQLMCESLNGTASKQGFLDSFVEDSNNAQRKVSVVTFGGENQATQPVTVLDWKDVKTEAGMKAVKDETSFENITSIIYSQTSQGHGLDAAIELLKDDSVKDIPNKYVVLLTDGRPEGSEIISSGAHTEEQAERVKDEANATLYAIGFGTKNITMYRDDHKPVNEWLAEEVSTPDCFIAAQSGEELNLGLEKISQTISAVANAWHVTDPMGENIIFKGFTEEKACANAAGDGTISWDLNKDTPSVVNGKNEYNLQYNIRLDNTKADFTEEKYYLTNGYTDLSYFFTEEVVENGKIIVSDTSAIHHLNFRVPSVQGYLGDVVFQKVSAESGNTLSGAEFKLTHNSDCSVCNGDISIAEQTAASDADGNVVIENIPSGHEYTMVETKAPVGHIKGAAFDVTVAYGKTYIDGKEVSASAPGTVENEPIAPVSTTLQAKKVMEGTELDPDKFYFELEDVNNQVIDTKKANADGDIVFDALTFDAPGEYHYSISEKITDDRDMNIIYDEAIFNVNVSVGVNNIENPTEYVVKDITYILDNDIVKPEFVNELRKPVEVILKGSKTMDEKLPAEGAFTFELKDKDGNVLQTKTNDAEGKVVFDALSFNQADIYEYTITEYISETPDEAIVYDRAVHNVKIDVTCPEDNFSSYQAKVTIDDVEDGSFVFENKTRKPAEVNLTASKMMEGATPAADAFNFILEGEDVNGNAISQTKSNDADGKVTFDTLLFDKTGTYEYKISELIGTDVDTIYDKTEYVVTVNVTAPDTEDSYVTDVTYKTTSGDSVEILTFENTSRDHVTAQFTAKKMMDGAPAADVYSFQLKDAQGEIIETVTNDENGNITFSEITYEAEGVHNYTITEVLGDNEKVVYDDRTYDVTVTITAPEDDGAYLVDVDYVVEGEVTDDVIFENVSREPGKVTLSATKTLDGEVPENGQFKFELKDADGNVLQTVANAEEGSIVFDELVFDESGVYNYVISEVNDGADGIIYDEASYNVQVEVTADVNGKDAFQTEVKIEKADEEVSEMIFENSIRKPVSVEFTANKTMDGEVPVSGDFWFALNGDTLSDELVKTTDDSGNVVFDGMTFDEVGTYNYTITEVKGDEGHIIYDGTVYDVTVEVTAPEDTDSFEAIVTYFKDGKEVKNVTFENMTRESAFVELSALKTLDDKAAKKGQFKFELKSEDGEILQTVENGRKGKIVFDALEFDHEGTYNYVISEVDTEKENIIYDESVYEVQIDVTYDAEGADAFQTEVKITKDGEAVEEILFENETVKVDPPVEDEDTPVEEIIEIVKTGDTSSPFFFGLVGVLSLLVAAMAVMLKRRFF